MVDALASGASTGNGVEVRVLSWAPKSTPKNQYYMILRGFDGFLFKSAPQPAPH